MEGKRSTLHAALPNFIFVTHALQILYTGQYHGHFSALLAPCIKALHTDDM